MENGPILHLRLQDSVLASSLLIDTFPYTASFLVCIMSEALSPQSQSSLSLTLASLSSLPNLHTVAYIITGCFCRDLSKYSSRIYPWTKAGHLNTLREVTLSAVHSS